jgi:hypothetical protein
MSVLLCKLGLASKDVCLYVLAPMIDRVSMAMLAEAFGIEPICCEAFYREAGRLAYWDICMRTQRYELANERFACGEGAAIGGFVEKIVDYVDKRRFGELFDSVDMLAPVHVWNYLRLHCHDCMGIRARFRRRVESGKALVGIKLEDNALPFLSDYTDLAMVAAGAGNGCDFMQWAVDLGDEDIKLACFRGVIRADNCMMLCVLLAKTSNKRLQYWHDVARDKFGPNLNAYMESMGVSI